MKTCRTIADVRAELASRRGGTIGLVPTMGALHDGHVSLLRAARSECDTVVMSLFVNPAQFSEAADLAAYPRDEERDLAAAEGAGVDLVFAPATDEMYPPGFQTWVEPVELGAVLEGAFRPGHFRAVATIVLKLYEIVRPQRVYFGQKDAQQAEAIRTLIRDLVLDVELRVLPTVRDADGLALSSRNVLLSPAERERARRPSAGTGDEGSRRGPRAPDPFQRARGRLRGDRRLPSSRPRCRGSHRLDPPHRQRPTGRRRRMSIRPQKPAPATPAPGKLPLTELAEMKARRQPIVMVTAYDAPGGRLADSAGVDLVLVGDSAAMTVLGHDSTVPATMDEMLMLTRAVTRGAVRPLVVADMPFGSFQVSDEDAVRNAIRFVKEAGADAVKLEGAGPMLDSRAGDRRSRDPRDGTPRADPADRDDARGLQGTGAKRGEGAAAARRLARSRGSGLLLARARGSSGTGRGAGHRESSRSRRSASVRGPAATARSSCGTTSSASTRAGRRGS